MSRQNAIDAALEPSHHQPLDTRRNSVINQAARQRGSETRIDIIGIQSGSTDYGQRSMAMCAGELALAVEVPPAFDEHLGLPLLANHFRIGGSLSDSPLELLTILNGEFIAHSVKPCPELQGVNAPLSLAATAAHRLLSRRVPSQQTRCHSGCPCTRHSPRNRRNRPRENVTRSRRRPRDDVQT